MKNITKTSLISLAVAAAIAMAPQAAFAHKSKKAHTHKKASSAAVAAPVSSNDARFRQLEAEIQSLRSELNKTRSETKSAVATVSEKAAAQDAALDAKLIKHEKKTGNNDLLFFRGGYASMTHPRNDELLTGNGVLAGGALGTTDHNQGNGWYIGAGFDHRLTSDLWGLTDMVALDGEVMFEYMNFGMSSNTLVTIYPAPAAAPAVGHVRNAITQFTLSASPKVKFNGLGDFRPWIIPFGLSINVISPPSSGVTVLNPGLMLGVGGEYRLWQSLWAGVTSATTSPVAT